MATVATPVITLTAGFYTGAQSTTVTCATDGATIFYTLDGTEPTHTGATPTGTTLVYSTAISISVSLTLNALGYLSGDTDSPATEENFYILAITSISGATLDDIGETVQLSGGVVTGGITNVTDWLSSNTAIATVNSAGLVTAVAAGNTVITARADELHSLLVTASITVGAVSMVDLTVLQNFLTDLVQTLGTQSPFLKEEQVTAQTALNHMRSNSLTQADLNFIQNLLNARYQVLNTAGPYQAAQLAEIRQALADVRSLI